MFRYNGRMICDLLDLTASEVKLMERKVQIKFVAVANVELKAGQEIDATLAVSENGFYTAEIKKGLVVSAYALKDQREATGRAAALATASQNP